MKKIVLEAEKVMGSVCFCIKEQTHRGDEFGRFVSSGVKMVSKTCPEVSEDDDGGVMFFVRGTNEKKDKALIMCDEKTFEKIEACVKAYNEKHSGKEAEKEEKPSLKCFRVE